MGVAAALLVLAPGIAVPAPLLQFPEPGRDVAVQSPHKSVGDWSSLATGAEAELTLRLLGVPASDDAAFDPAAMQAALLLDPSEEGLQAIAQSLRDNAALRQVLGTTVALRDDRAVSDLREAAAAGVLVADALTAADPRAGIPDPLRSATGRPQAAVRQADRRNRNPQQRDQSEEMLDTSLVQDDGPTLRTVLRSMVRVRRTDDRQRPQTVANSVTNAAEDIVDDGLNLGERLLDSRILGDAFQMVIGRPVDYEADNSFSILGRGRFDLELDLSSDLGGVSIFEHTSGASLSMPLERTISTEPEQRPRQTQEKVDLVQVVSNFMRSATGVSLMFISSVTLIVLFFFRFAMGLRR